MQLGVQNGYFPPRFLHSPTLVLLEAEAGAVLEVVHPLDGLPDDVGVGLRGDAHLQRAGVRVQALALPHPAARVPHGGLGRRRQERRGGRRGRRQEQRKRHVLLLLSPF